MTIINFTEIENMVAAGKLYFHHTAWAKGYVCKGYQYVEKYSGKFGKGYKVHCENCSDPQNERSNQYHHVKYYIYK